MVRRIKVADIAEALGQGLRDFQAAPLYGLAFGAFYAAGGIVILLSLTAFGLVYLAYPLAAGFALLGPFVAIGLYEVSRQREAGQPLSLRDDLRRRDLSAARSAGWRSSRCSCSSSGCIRCGC